MQFLKADTAVKVVIGPVVAVGDGFTPVTTLSLSTADEAELIKHDAAAVTSISGNTFAAITSMDGYYNLTLTAAQLDTEGMLVVAVNDDSLCLPVRHDFMVVNANVYDSLFAAAGTDLLDVQVGGMDANVLTAAAINASALDGKGDWNIGKTGYSLTQVFPTNFADLNIEVTTGRVDLLAATQASIDAIEADTNELQTDDVPGLIGALNDPTAAAVADAVWDETQAAHVGAGTFGEVATEIGTILARVPDTISLANINAEADTALTDYDAPTKAEMDSGFSGLNDLSAAQVNAEVDQAFVDNLVIRRNTAAAGAAGTITLDGGAPATADLYNGCKVALIGGTGVGQTRLITDYSAARVATVSPNWVTNPDATSVFLILPNTDVINTYVGNTKQTGDSFNRLGAPAGASVSADIATVDGNVDAILLDTAEIGAAGAGLSAIPWNPNWDVEVQSECADALVAYDPPTKAELDAGFGALNDPTAATIADTVWDEAQADHAAAGSMGEMAAEIAAILADTNELQTDDVPGLIAALNNLAAGDVLTQVNAALDTAIAELGVAAPTATPTLRTGLMLLYMMARNRLDVSTSGADELQVYNDAGTVIAKKALSDDGSDYSETEMASG